MDYSEWTSCEMYGHRFEDCEYRENWRVCTDCGDSYEDEAEVNSCVMCTPVDIDCDQFTGDLENIRTTAKCKVCGADLEAIVKLADVLLGTASEWTKVVVNN